MLYQKELNLLVIFCWKLVQFCSIFTRKRKTRQCAVGQQKQPFLTSLYCNPSVSSVFDINTNCRCLHLASKHFTWFGDCILHFTNTLQILTCPNFVKVTTMRHSTHHPSFATSSSTALLSSFGLHPTGRTDKFRQLPTLQLLICSCSAQHTVRSTQLGLQAVGNQSPLRNPQQSVTNGNYTNSNPTTITGGCQQHAHAWQTRTCQAHEPMNRSKIWRYRKQYHLHYLYNP